MTINELGENQLFIAIISLLGGGFLTYLATQLANRTKSLRYTINTNRIGSSLSDPVFGNIKINWQGQELRNLYFANIEIENTSSRDLENIVLKFYVAPETKLMSEKAVFSNSTYGIQWTNEYSSKLITAPGAIPTPDQFVIYNSHREYFLPAFKRYSKATFAFLCTRPIDDQFPHIFIESPTAGVKMTQQKIIGNNGLIFSIPTQTASIIGIVISAVCCILSIIFCKSIVVVAILNNVIGLLGALWGALLYRGLRKIKRIINS